MPNLAIVRPGSPSGDLTIKLFTQNASATAHVVVDVFGWFSTSSNADHGARLVPIAPGRILDTRDGAGALGRAQSIELQVRGATLNTGQTIGTGSDIVGVVLNLTGINTQADSIGTFLSVVPELPPGAIPTTSNVNLARGQIKPNMVIVPIGADGKIRIYNHAGEVHLAVDVAGYLTTTAPDGSTSTPNDRTISTVPASTRLMYMLPLRGLYSIATRFTPESRWARPASNSCHFR